MPVITLPDGSQRNFDQPVSVHDVATDIGPGLAKAALAGVCLAIVLYSMAHYRWLERPLHHLFRRWLRA